MTSQMFIPIHRKILFVLTCIVITAGCAGFEGQSKPAAVPEIHPGILAGYLQPEVLPNSLALIPPPPVADFITKHTDIRKLVRWSLLPLVGISWVVLKIGPLYSLAVMVLLGFGLIGLARFGRKFQIK